MEDPARQIFVFCCEVFEIIQRRKVMEYLDTAQELLDFIMRCKSPFHVVKEASDLLNENG